MFAEARAVGRQNLRGHLQCHASKGQESNLGHRPSCPIRKHCKPPLVDPSQQKACRGSQQSPILISQPASVDSKPLRESLSTLNATLTKNRGAGSSYGYLDSGVRILSASTNFQLLTFNRRMPCGLRLLPGASRGHQLIAHKRELLPVRRP